MMRHDASPGEPAAAAPLWFFASTLVLLILALLLGGGRGGAGDAVVQCLACLLLIAQCGMRTLSPLPTSLLVAAGLAMVLPLLHALPLPLHEFWPGPIGMQALRDAEAASTAIDRPLGLDALAAERALLFLLTPLAMLTAVARLGQDQRRRLLALLLLVAAVNVLLGIAQLADGEQSRLRLHSPTNISDAVGFFANRNHFAALLAASLPFAVGAAALVVRRRARGQRIPLVVAFVFAGVAALLLLGIALSRSRAGLLLAVLALVLAAPVLWRLLRREGARSSRGWMLLLLPALVLPIAIFAGMRSDPFGDGRWTYARVTLAAAADAAPLGSGIGTFGDVYPEYEARAGAGPGYAVVNHAHNDALELWLEAGVPFALVLAAFLWLFLRQGWTLLGTALPAEVLATARLAWIAALLLLLHSTLDYPLRTTALATLFAVLFALALPPAGTAPDAQRRRDAASANSGRSEASQES